MRRAKVVVVILVFLAAGAYSASAYTVGAVPPTGLGSNSPYLYISAGGQTGYIYPTAAQLDIISIGGGDVLSANLSATATNFTQGNLSQIVTFPFFNSVAGDDRVGMLTLYLLCNSGYNSQSFYPVSIRWYFRLGTNTSYFGGNASPVVGPVVVLDTNIPSFAPRSEALAMQSSNNTLMFVLCVLLAVFLLLQLIQFIGRYRKGAGGY